MTKIFFISLFISFWLGCSGIQTKNNTDLEVLTLWTPMIALLNDVPGPPSQSLDEMRKDLLLENSQELAEINRQYNEVIKSEFDANKLGKSKNEFFHHEIEKLNAKTVSRLIIANKDPEIINTDYRTIAQQILELVESDPVVSSNNIYSYDGGDQIGFCFGRAMLVHYLLIKSGVDPQDILKIFSIGDLKVSSQFWHFHVAVMIKDRQSHFIVIDPLFKEPLAYDIWMDNNRVFEIKYPLSRLRFYITDPRKFLPASGMYEPSLMQRPEYKAYFYDLAQAMPSILKNLKESR